MDESTPPRDRGPTDATAAGTVECRECGARFDDGLTACPDCGAARVDAVTAERGPDAARSLTDQYSPVTWVLSLLVAFLTFPFGLVVPLYFLVKATRTDAVSQGRLEVAAVLLLNVVGIAAVEWRGERGARFALGFVAAMTAMGVILLVVFLLGAAA